MILYALIKLLQGLIEKLFLLAEMALGRILDLLYEIFEVFAGITPIKYYGEKSYLIDTFFSNNIITAIYKGMALIGIAMTFGFAVVAVIKKGFDSSGEKVKATYGMIIGNVLKAILLILLMTAIVSATITATGVLMQQIDYLFDNAEEIADPSEISFDDNDYATMFRIIDTIGNYSLNTSFNSRFNINSCFNAIRMDMQVLEQTGMFNFTYDLTSEAENSWQAALLKIYNAADIYSELPVDQYNDRVNSAICSCVEKIQKDASFKPLSYYFRGTTKSSDGAVLGRTILLASSFEAANSSRYNKNPSLTDGLRRAYYTGSKNIYSYGQVTDDFDISFGSWNHLVAIFVNIILIMEFFKILINCTARIFNIILLYITAPGFASAMPLDDGGKMKQWTTAFVIQSLSIFGTIIAVRLMVVFIPIVLNSELVLFSSAVKNMLAKIILIVGICETAQKASGMISGILADNAGYQSIIAGDVGSGTLSKGMALGSKALSVAASAVKTVDGAILKGAADVTGLTTVGKKISNWGSNKAQAMRDKGGIVGAWKKGFTSNAQDKAAADQKEQTEEKQFRANLMDKLDKLGGAGGPGGGAGGPGGGSGGPDQSSSAPNTQPSNQPANLSNPQASGNPKTNENTSQVPGAKGQNNGTNVKAPSQAPQVPPPPKNPVNNSVTSRNKNPKG